DYVVGVLGALRAVERANAEMDDANADRARIVGGTHDRRRQPGEGVQRQPAHPFRSRGTNSAAGCGCSFTRETSCVGLTKRNAISSHVSVTSMYTIAIASTDCGARTP